MAADFTFKNYEEHEVKTDDTLDKLARGAGVSWRQLAMFNWGVESAREINRCLHEYVGCRHRTRNGKNFIFTSEDDPGIIYLPKPSPDYHVQTGRRYVFEAQCAPAYSKIEVETVDEFGYRVPEVSLVLESLDGFPDVNLTTDATGYAQLARAIAGRYRVSVDGKQPGYFLRNLESVRSEDDDPDYADYTEAVIDTRYQVVAVTRIVVKRDASPEDRRQRNNYKKIYRRTQRTGENIDSRGTATSGATRRSLGFCCDNLAVAAGWTDDKFSKVDVQCLVKDLLPDFLKDRLPTALGRKFYVLLAEPYEDKETGQPLNDVRLTFIDEGYVVGPSFKLLHSFSEGPIGAYSTFEELGGHLFYDIATHSCGIVKQDSGGSPQAPSDGSEPSASGDKQRTQTVDLTADPANGLSPATGIVDDGPYYLEEHVNEPNMFIEELNKRAGKVQILFWLRSPRIVWQAALHGGTGRLEEYPKRDEKNPADKSTQELASHIHKRNRLTAQNVTRAYPGYVQLYINSLEEIANEVRRSGKPSAEQQNDFEDRLRELGPPLAPYEMPIPPNATDSEKRDIFAAHSYPSKLHDEFEPWIKIAELLDDFSNVKTQGLPFLRIKPKWGSIESTKGMASLLENTRPTISKLLGRQRVGVEVEGNLEIQIVDGEIRTLGQVEKKWVVTAGLNEALGELTINGSKALKSPLLQKLSLKFAKVLPVEVEVKGEIETGEGEKMKLELGEAEEYTLKVAKVFEVEASLDGNMKFTLEPFPEAPMMVQAEGNPLTGEMAGGVKFTGEQLAEQLEGWGKGLKKRLGDEEYLQNWPQVKRYLERHEGGVDEAVGKVADVLKGLELEIEVGYVGTREETILAVVSMAPGFFQRRSIKNLFDPKTLWNELTSDEHISLVNLGWTSHSWDYKYEDLKLIPPSAKKKRDELTPAEKIAIVHLGFRAYGDYGRSVKEGCREHGEKGGGEEGEPGGEPPAEKASDTTAPTE